MKSVKQLYGENNNSTSWVGCLSGKRKWFLGGGGWFVTELKRGLYLWGGKGWARAPQGLGGWVRINGHAKAGGEERLGGYMKKEVVSL